MNLENGTIINQYKILSSIGKGGMGEVFLAQDTKLDRKVALKILPAEFAEDADRMSRFVREAKSASALNHPNIITIHEIGESDGTHFIATEFIDGKTLGDYKQANLLNYKSALEIAIQVASALDEAHQAGIVHRDIKPDNIMIRANGLAKILDFGIAKLSAPTESGEDAVTAIQSQTQAGMIIGTPNYMSPEQARGKGVNHQIDIFSFGVVLYEMLSGVSPFKGETVSDVIAAVLTKEPKPLTNVPPELAEIVHKTLQKDKRNRYQTAKDLLNDLKEVKQELEIQSRLGRNSVPHLEEPQTQILQAPTTAEKPTGSTTDAEDGFWVAVLPFKYRGANADLEALAEGLSEEIVTGLSRFSYLRVIARGSTLRNESDAGDVRAIGKELGARYVMEGSLRQVGATMRLAVYLVDTSNGVQLWSENYQRAFSSEALFDLQDELVPRIVSTVADWYGVLPHFMSEFVRLKSPEKLSPYEALLRSFGYTARLSPEDHLETRDILERAVGKSPENADCWAMLSTIYADEYKFGYNLKPDPLKRTLAAALRAVEAAPSNSFANYALAQARFFRKEFDAFRSAAERAIALNPMNGAVAAYMGQLLHHSGDTKRGCELSEKARQLNPQHPGWYWSVPFLQAYAEQDYRRALDYVLKMNMPGLFVYHMHLAATYGQLGEHQLAAQSARDLLAVAPDIELTVREFSEKWVNSETVEHLLEGLQKAGLKIAAAPNQEEPKTQILKAQTPAENEMQNSIAVLPFENKSSDADSDYLSDGLAESLIYRLSQLPDLKVSPTSSVFRYKGKATDPQVIAKELGVDSVLTGRITQRGDALNISVNLVDTRNGKSLWGEQYERKMSELLATQKEIAAEITNNLKLKLSGESEQKLAKRYTDNNEAYQLYLKGSYHYARRTKADILKGIDYFEQAIKLDPRFALAYATIAESYNSLGKNADLPPKDVVPQAKAAATRALEIDPTLAEAHGALADSLALYDWNWAESEREYGKAFQLDPNVSYIHLTRGASYFVPTGKRDDAVAELKRAVELEPLSLITNAIFGLSFLYAGQTEKALEQGKKAYDLEPNFRFGRQYLGYTYITLGRYDDAIELAEKGLKTSPLSQEDLVIVGIAYAKSGRKLEAEQYLDRFRELAKTRYVRTVYIASICAALGDKDKAFAELEKSFADKDCFLPRIKLDPFMDPLRSDPRYKDLLKRMNLPE